MSAERLSNVDVSAPDGRDGLLHLGIDFRKLRRRRCVGPHCAQADYVGVRKLGS